MQLLWNWSIKKALKRDAIISEMAGIRRLFNESYAAAAAEMKAMIEQSEEAPVKRLAAAERAERYREQQMRLKGLKIQGQQEPGDSLVDLAVGIYEADRLEHISWELCVSREHEILTSTKKDPLLSFDSNGALKVAKRDHVAPCDVSSELHVKYCLTRRGLALEQANILAFDKHDAWCELLFHRRMMDPPPGYAKVTFKQLQLADAKLFVVLGEATRSGIKVTSAGTRPCDDKFIEAMNCAEVQHLLQPMPARYAEKPDLPARTSPPVKQTITKGKGSGKQAGKKGKSNAWRPSIPQELLAMGCVGITNRGNPLCFDFQMQKCSLPVNNQRCSKGFHLCAMPRCHKDHPAKECPSGRKRE